MPWQVAFLASVAIAVPYFAISWFVARGLGASGQLSSNRLGLATAVIFFSRGVGHALHAEDEATSVALRLIDGLRDPFHVGGEQISLTASAGVALGSPGQTNAAELMHRADEAMYAAKAGGRNRLEVFA